MDHKNLEEKLKDHNNNRKRKVVELKTTDSEPLELKRPYKLIDEYYSFITFKREPLSDRGLDRLCDELLDWAKNGEHCCRIMEFRILKGIGIEKWEEWLVKFPSLAQAEKEARQILGIQRYKKASNRETSEGIFKFLQYRYDDEWKKADEYHNEQKRKLLEKTNTEPTTIIVKLIDHKDEEE